MPAFLAGDTAYTFLNAGQIPVVKQRMPDSIRTNAVFATSYISFDLKSPPFDNVDVRRAFYYAVNRAELTSTVLKDIAIPAGSILAPGYPGYSENNRQAGRLRPAEGQGLPRQGRLSQRRRLPDCRSLVPRRRWL